MPRLVLKWLVGGVVGAVTLSGSASAQDVRTQVALSGAAGVSIQPVDDAYVGAPYLDKGLGGVGPAAAFGLNLRHRRFVATFEFTTAWLEVQQEGRLVAGGSPPGAASGPGRVRDSMLSGLAGARIGADPTAARLLAGVSQLLDTPTSNGVSLDDPEGDTRRQVFTAGVDVTRRLSARTSFIVTTRGYFGIDRNSSQQQIGLGRHIVRVGAGLSVGFGREN